MDAIIKAIDTLAVAIVCITGAAVALFGMWIVVYHVDWSLKTVITVVISTAFAWLAMSSYPCAGWISTRRSGSSAETTSLIF